MKLGTALAGWVKCDVVASGLRAMGCRPPGLVDRPVGMTLGDLGPFGPECVHPASLIAEMSNGAGS